MNNFEFYTPSTDHSFLMDELGLCAGDKLRARHELYDHVGTVGYDGLIYAASFKFGKVTKTSFEQFSGGKTVTNEGHVGPLSVEEVINRYESILNNPYGLINSNCEHTDNWARGLGWKSEQVKNVALAACVAVLMGATLANFVRR